MSSDLVTGNHILGFRGSLHISHNGGGRQWPFFVGPGSASGPGSAGSVSGPGSASRLPIVAAPLRIYGEGSDNDAEVFIYFSYCRPRRPTVHTTHGFGLLEKLDTGQL